MQSTRYLGSYLPNSDAGRSLDAGWRYGAVESIRLPSLCIFCINIAAIPSHPFTWTHGPLDWCLWPLERTF